MTNQLKGNKNAKTTKMESNVCMYVCMLWIFIQDSLFSSQGELLSMRVLRRRS